MAAMDLASLIQEERKRQAEQKMNLKSMLEARLANTAPAIDLSPTMATLEQATGGGGALTKAAAQSAATAEARQNDIDKIAQAGLDTKGDALAIKDLIAASKGEGTQDRFLDAKIQAMNDRMAKRADKINDSLAEFGNDVGSFQGALDSGNYQQVTTLLDKLARGVGGQKGVLTDTDIQRTMPSTIGGSIEKFKMYLGQQGKIPPEIKANMQALIERAKVNFADQARKKVKMFKTTSSTSKYAKDAGLDDIAGELEDQIEYIAPTIVPLEQSKGTAPASGSVPATPASNVPQKSAAQLLREKYLKKAQ